MWSDARRDTFPRDKLIPRNRSSQCHDGFHRWGAAFTCLTKHENQASRDIMNLYEKGDTTVSITRPYN